MAIVEKQNERPFNANPSRPYWIERHIRGSKVFCFRVRKHGKWMVVKFTLKDIEELLKEP